MLLFWDGGGEKGAFNVLVCSEFEISIFYLILFTAFLFRLCVKHTGTFICSIIIYQYTKLETHGNLTDPYLINLYTGSTVLVGGS